MIPRQRQQQEREREREREKEREGGESGTERKLVKCTNVVEASI